MKLTLAEPKYLKESISIISELVNDAKLNITPNAIELVAMDPANVAMVVFKLLSSAFVEYEIKSPVEISINLNNLKAVLRRAKDKDMVSLELADNKLKIKFKSNTTRTFSLPIIDIDEKQQKVPELSFPVSITTDSSILSDSIDDADIIGESVSFMAEPKKFTVLAEGDLNKAQIEINADEQTEIKADAPVRAKYSVEYLKKMVQGAKLSDKVIVQFNKDYPLKLSYVSVDRVSLSFILAPRVEND